MAGSIPAFQNTLFLQPQAYQFPNLNRATEDKVYSIAQKPQLGIEQKVAKGDADLKEISAFVRGVLADKPRLAQEVQGLSFDKRLYLHINLNKISSYIETHNKKVDANFLITLVHVILLILTFGGFRYRDTLHIENFVSTLAGLGATKAIPLTDGPGGPPPLDDDGSDDAFGGEVRFGELSSTSSSQKPKIFDLHFVHLLLMSKEDRELVLESTGLLEKWKAFADKCPKLLEKGSTIEVQSLLSTITLADLEKVRSFEETRLVLLLDKADFDKLPFGNFFYMKEVEREPIFERAGLFHKWEAFTQKYETANSSSSFQHVVLASLPLAVLEKATDLEQTPLALLWPKKEGVEANPIELLIKVFHPYVKSLGPEDQKNIMYTLPDNLAQCLQQSLDGCLTDLRGMDMNRDVDAAEVKLAVAQEALELLEMRKKALEQQK